MQPSWQTPAGPEEEAPEIALPEVSPNAPIKLPPKVPKEVQWPNLPVPEFKLSDWLLEARPYRKIALANRYFFLTQVTSFLVGQFESLKKPYFVVSEHLQHVQGARSAFRPELIGPGAQAPAGLGLTNFDQRYVDPNAVILYEGNHSELVRLQGWPGSVIHIVGYGIDAGRLNDLLQGVGPTDILRVMYPESWVLDFDVDIIRMSPYQTEQYRLARSEEIASGVQAKAALASGVVSPPRYGRYGKKLQSPEKSTEYESQIMLHGRQRANMAYPFAIQAEYNRSDKTGRRVPKDARADQGGWIDLAFVQQLEQYSPKIVRLIARIFARSKAAGASTLLGKYLVSVSFKEHHGMFAIAAILSYYGVEVVMVHGSLGRGQEQNAVLRQQQVQRFNALPAGVLMVTNSLTFDFTLRNIDELIIFDATPFPNSIYALIGTFFHDTLYDSPRVVPAVFLVSAESEKKTSADGKYYKKFQVIEAERYSAYSQLESRARVLVVRPEGLFVAQIPGASNPSLVAAMLAPSPGVVTSGAPSNF